MLEAETLGPLTLLQPGDKVVHEEFWHACEMEQTPGNEKDAAMIFEEDDEEK